MVSFVNNLSDSLFVFIFVFVLLIKRRFHPMIGGMHLIEIKIRVLICREENLWNDR